MAVTLLLLLLLETTVLFFWAVISWSGYWSLTGNMWVCWCDQMESCHMWGVHEVQVQGTTSILGFLTWAIFSVFFSGFCTYIVQRLENFDCGNDRSLDLRSYILANRRALMVRHATSYTVSAIQVETMNGPIGINRPQDIGWKIWLLYLGLQMNLGMTKRWSKKAWAGGGAPAMQEQ